MLYIRIRKMRRKGMHPKKTITFFFLLLGWCTLYLLSGPDLNGQLIYQKTYGGPLDENLYTVKQTNDGGFIMSGATRSAPSQGERDMLFHKVDVAGTTQWTRTFGDASRDIAWDALQTSDGGYLFPGANLVLNTATDRDVMVKYDAAGNQSWVRYNSGGGDDEIFACAEVPGVGYVYGGFSQSFSANGRVDVSIYITSTAGNLLTGNHFGGPLDDYAYDMVPTSDLGYVLAGRTNSFGGGGWDIYVVKVNALLQVQWARALGGAQNDEAWSIRQTSDGGYIVGGYTASFGAGAEDGILVKLNAQGNLQWARTYGGPGNDRINQVKQTSDGGYIVAGYTAQGFGGTDAFLMKLTGAPATTWSKVYGGIQEDQGWGVDIRSANQGYVMVGHTASFGAGGRDGYLVVTDLNGNSGCNENPVTLTPTVINPALTGSATTYTGLQVVNLPLVQGTPNFPSNCVCTDYEPNNGIQGLTLVCTGATGNNYFINDLDHNPTINWTVTNGNVINTQGDTAIVVDFSNQNATIRVDAAWTGCTALSLDTITVVIGDIDVTISGDSVSCAGDQINLQANLQGGTGLVNYLWSTGSTQTAIVANPSQTVQYTITVTDAIGCVDSAQQQVIVNPYPVVQLGNDTIVCTNPPIIVLDAGNPGATYVWSNNANTQQVQVTQTGLWWVNVDLLGCVSSDSINIGQAPQPQVTVSGDTLLCIGDATTLNVAVSGGLAPYQILWNTGSSANNITLTPANTQPVSVTVTDQNTCVVVRTVNVTVFPYPVVNLGADTVVCSAPPYILNAGNPGAQYLWNDGTNGPFFNVVNNGLYWVDVDANGCVTRDSVNVRFDSIPTVALPDLAVICGNTPALVDAENPNATYSWSNGDTARIARFNVPGLYFVAVTRCGVTIIDSVDVIGGYDPERIYAPTAFTPNGDGINETFSIHYSFPGIDISEDFYLEIFDRWGQPLKLFTGPNDQWDGTYDGLDQVPNGAYAYRLVVRNRCFTKPVERMGRIMVLR